MTTVASNMTCADLLQSPGLGRCELVRGELIMMTPAGFEHGRIVGNITWALKDYVRQHPRGVVTGAETGFWIGRNPDTVRAPDAAFVAASRIPAEPIRDYFEGAPDLAVEVLSPNDRAGEVLAKVRGWLAAGCRVIWVVDPQSVTVTVYRGDTVSPLGSTDTLVEPHLLPEFSLPVRDVFA
jgi:Uma2 family endonuclease